mmetsp:Transcript_10278/g.26096  ORF Transcript_10278/g.26096 Transcript_10278/m.26096 type:complete len:489 (+) Transcript_10278:258-1724(+)
MPRIHRVPNVNPGRSVVETPHGCLVSEALATADQVPFDQVTGAQLHYRGRRHVVAPAVDLQCLQSPHSVPMLPSRKLADSRQSRLHLSLGHKVPSWSPPGHIVLGYRHSQVQCVRLSHLLQPPGLSGAHIEILHHLRQLLGQITLAGFPPLRSGQAVLQEVLTEALGEHLVEFLPGQLQNLHSTGSHHRAHVGSPVTQGLLPKHIPALQLGDHTRCFVDPPLRWSLRFPPLAHVLLSIRWRRHHFQIPTHHEVQVPRTLSFNGDHCSRRSLLHHSLESCVNDLLACEHPREVVHQELGKEAALGGHDQGPVIFSRHTEHHGVLIHGHSRRSPVLLRSLQRALAEGVNRGHCCDVPALRCHVLVAVGLRVRYCERTSSMNLLHRPSEPGNRRRWQLRGLLVGHCEVCARPPHAVLVDPHTTMEKHVSLHSQFTLLENHIARISDVQPQAAYQLQLADRIAVERFDKLCRSKHIQHLHHLVQSAFVLRKH